MSMEKIYDMFFIDRLIRGLPIHVLDPFNIPVMQRILTHPVVAQTAVN